MPRLSPPVMGRMFSNASYLPRVVTMLRDWRPFVADYLAMLSGIDRPARAYRFRNGMTVNTRSLINTQVLGEVFLKRAYGSVRDGSVVIDVGAHIGVFSLFAASSGSTVYAYEPMPDNFRLLEQNIRLNGLEDRIIPHRLGLAGIRTSRQLYAAPSDMQYSVHRDYYGPSRESVAIECVTLEDIFAQHRLERCNLLKLDCEGAEYESVYNTPLEILERIDEIRMEYHRGIPDTPWGASRPEHLGCYLEQHGFRVTRYQDTEAKVGLLWATRLG